MALFDRMEPLDICRSAMGMARIYGDDAESEALARVEKFGKLQDSPGVQNWNAIAQAIRLLKREAAVTKAVAENVLVSAFPAPGVPNGQSGTTRAPPSSTDNAIPASNRN